MNTKETADKLVKNTEQKEIETPPIFKLAQWKKDHLPDTPEMRAYDRAVQQQKLILIVASLLIATLAHYLKYGVA